MSNIHSIAQFLEQFAPTRLAEDWDNVGLLVGDPDQPVRRVMTCLTITPQSTDEAIRAKADLIVTHHPMPFRPLKRLTTETPTGRMLLNLIGSQIAIYSPHTAFDSAVEGINQSLAEGLHLEAIRPLLPQDDGPGAGRFGQVSTPIRLEVLADRVKLFLGVDGLQIVGHADQQVHKVAVACGAAGEFLERALEQHCDAMLLGEARFHTCLDAEAHRIGLILPGHFASERFAVENLAQSLAQEFPALEIWASHDEHDPLRWFAG